MTSEEPKARRLTVEDLKSERERAAAEKAANDERLRELAGKLTNARNLWGTLFQRVGEAVATANRLTNGVGVQSSAQEKKPPKGVERFGYSNNLLGVVVSPPQPKSLPGRRTRPPSSVPDLRIGMSDDGRIEVVRTNYKMPPNENTLRFDLGEFSAELIDQFVLDFVNDGLLGLPADVEELKDEAEHSNRPEWTTAEAASASSLPSSAIDQIRNRAPKALRDNARAIDFAAAGLLQLLDARIESLGLPNSDEAKAELQSIQDLKARIEVFLEAAHQFLADAAKQVAAVDKTISLAQGTRNFWHERHEEICTKLLDGSVFGSLVCLCLLAGATGNVAAIIPAMIVGGKPVADVLASWAKKE
jgi:hypothetical protein